jgi:starch phosphorylase
VHLPTWTHPAVARLLGAADRAPRAEDFATRAPKASPADLWAARVPARRALLERVRHGVERAFVAGTLSTADFDRATAGLAEGALLVGFARRFASYKRAHLLLKDVARLERIVSSTDRPVRVFFAGKSHPDDREGRGILRRVAEAARSPALEGKVFLLEDYGIALARALAQGVDVWLNNPLRGLEASGTSGMKVAANGGLNLSVPDGWWPEAFDGQNGWSIGAPAALDGGPGQDESDAASLYDLLEREVVPLFFDRDPSGVPLAWCAKALRSLATIPPVFDSDRMLREYAAASYSR